MRRPKCERCGEHRAISSAFRLCEACAYAEHMAHQPKPANVVPLAPRQAQRKGAS